MRAAVAIFFVGVLVSSAFTQEHPDGCCLRVRITNLRSDTGNVAVALYNSADGFPEDSNKVFRAAIGDARDGESTVTFSSIPFGTYAIAVLHDENRNGRMDKGLFGIPKEGYGFSNDAMGFMGPPGFDKAGFSCGNDTVSVTIRIGY
jgi:uncharacterized protein (DUF2141 family)